MLVRIVQVLGHLSYSLGQHKEALTKLAERLNEPGYDRTPDGYAAMFGQFFKGEPTLSLDNPAWIEDRGWQIGTTILSAITAVCSILWAIK